MSRLLFESRDTEAVRSANLPDRPCIRRYEGDTTTGIVTFGRIPWHVEMLSKATGFSTEEAFDVVLLGFNEEHPGAVYQVRADGKWIGVEHDPYTLTVRLCEKCAKETGVSVQDIERDEVEPLVDPGLAEVFKAGAKIVASYRRTSDVD